MNNKTYSTNNSMSTWYNDNSDTISYRSLPKIRHTWPKLLAEEIVSVQPLGKSEFLSFLKLFEVLYEPKKIVNLPKELFEMEF